MSLIHMSGFEGAPKGRENPTPGVTYAAGGRTGMYALIPGGGNNVALNFATPTNELIFGIAVKPSTNYDGGQPIQFIPSSAEGSELTLQFTSNGSFTLIRSGQYGATNVIASVTAAYGLDVWNYIEAHYKLDPINGFARIWVNGTKVVDFSGDTQGNGGSTSIPFTGITFYGPGQSWAGSCQFDDFYILDGTDATATQGRPFNTVLGMPRIEAILPNGNGSVNDWVGSDGNSVDNYQLIDEMPPSATDYVESSTTGQRDLYDFAAPTVNGQILAVDVTAYAASPDGGINPLKTVRRSAAGTVQVGPGIIPGTAYKNLSDGPKGKDPDGADWTASSINSATFGVEVG